MRSFLVSFHKVVPAGAGHDRRALQRQVVVAACSDVSATKVAKAMFCAAAGIVDWRLRADSCDVAELTDRIA